MRPEHRRGICRAVAPLLLTVALLLTACSGPSGSSSPTTASGTSSPPPTEVTTDASKCDGAWTTPLAVTAEVASEVPYLSQVSACTNQNQRETKLINNSDIVWAIYSNPGGADVTHTPPTQKQSIFRASVPSGHIPVMEPGSSVAIAASPSVTMWYADPVLTSVWRSESTLFDARVKNATDAIKDLLPDLFSPRSARCQAWITCGIAVYDAADATVTHYGENLDAKGLPQLVKDAQSLGQSEGSCQEKLQAVDETDLREARISAPTLPTARALADETSWAAKARKDFHGASILRAAIRLHR